MCRFPSTYSFVPNVPFKIILSANQLLYIYLFYNVTMVERIVIDNGDGHRYRRDFQLNRMGYLRRCHRNTVCM